MRAGVALLQDANAVERSELVIVARGSTDAQYLILIVNIFMSATQYRADSHEGTPQRVVQ